MHADSPSSMRSVLIVGRLTFLVYESDDAGAAPGPEGPPCEPPPGLRRRRRRFFAGSLSPTAGPEPEPAPAPAPKPLEECPPPVARRAWSCSLATSINA